VQEHGVAVHGAERLLGLVREVAIPLGAFLTGDALFGASSMRHTPVFGPELRRSSGVWGSDVEISIPHCVGSSGSTRGRSWSRAYTSLACP
jgi:hypothetical protein